MRPARRPAGGTGQGGAMRPRLAPPLTIVVTALLVMLVLAPWAGATTSPQPNLSPGEKTLMTAISQDYAYDLTDRLSSFDYPFLGEVVSGSAEDLAASAYVAQEMRDLGLTGVTLESFGLVGWEFGDATVRVTSPVSRLLTHVRSIDGCPGTPQRQAGARPAGRRRPGPASGLRRRPRRRPGQDRHRRAHHGDVLRRAGDPRGEAVGRRRRAALQPRRARRRSTRTAPTPTCRRCT